MSSKSLTMKKNSKRPLTPKLRFPEFRAAPGWENLTLGDITTKTDKRNKEGKGYPVFSISNKTGFTPQSEQFEGMDSEKRGYDIALYKLIGPKTFAYNPARINVGSIGYSGDLDNIIISSLYVCFKARPDVDDQFLLNFFGTSEFEKSVNNHVEGGIRSYLFYENFARIGVPIPPIKEQQKIADCLDSLDGLIAAEGRMLAALRDHKRGLMEQLFPQPGETKPRLRFPEFRDKREWEEKELGDICEILNNRRVPISSNDRTPGPYPYYGASGVVDFVDDYIFDERLVLVGEDGAKWKAFEETAFIAEGQYWVNNHAHVLKPSGVIDILLVNYLTMIDVGDYVTGNAPSKLTLAKLKTIPVPISRYMEEQHRIADCLTALDTLIAAQAAYIEALKQHKRGLMQQLFPAPEGQ